MRVTLTRSEPVGASVPATLLGHNLEVFGDTVRDLCSDRLDNPKFAGPASPQTGIARNWRPFTSNFMGVRYELVHGEGLLGREAQLVESTSERRNKGLVQPGRWVRKGERLEISFWARALHEPVRVRVGIRPAAVWADDYGAGEVLIDSACFREYKATVTAPCDDDDAAFFCFIEQPGVILLDQIHLRPEGSGIIREDVLSTFGSFGIPVLRFPGGCISTAYHWQYGTGPQHLRPVLPDPVFKREVRYEFGTDEYLQFCHQYGIVPLITANVGTGTPVEAAEWADYCWSWFQERGVEPPMMYWMLGCEHYGHWSRGHMTVEMYADAIRHLAPGIREAYPRARIIALGAESADHLQSGKRPWRAPLLEQAAEHIDLLSLQLYAILPFDRDAARQHAKVLEAASHVLSQLRRAVEDCRRHGDRIRVALTEWNLWIHASHFDPHGFVEPADIQHGLYAANLFHHAARLAPTLELTCHYNLVAGMGVFAVEKQSVRPTHVADVFELYRPAFPGRLIPLAMDPEAAGDAANGVDALALQGADSSWLFVVNSKLDEAVSVELRGFQEVKEGTTLRGEHPLDLAAIREDARVAAHRLEVPPLSMTRLELPR